MSYQGWRLAGWLGLEAGGSWRGRLAGLRLPGWAGIEAGGLAGAAGGIGERQARSRNPGSRGGGLGDWREGFVLKMILI